MSGRFGRHQREMVAVVATALAAGGVFVLIAANPGVDPTRVKSTPFEEATPDPKALLAARSDAVTEIAAAEDHIRHFEWGIGNLLRNISLLDFRGDVLSDEIRKRRQANQGVGDQQHRKAEIEAMRLDYMGEIERAQQAISGLEGEIAAHRATIEKIDRTLGGLRAN